MRGRGRGLGRRVVRVRGVHPRPQLTYVFDYQHPEKAQAVPTLNYHMQLATCSKQLTAHSRAYLHQPPLPAPGGWLPHHELLTQAWLTLRQLPLPTPAWLPMGGPCCTQAIIHPALAHTTCTILVAGTPHSTRRTAHITQRNVASSRLCTSDGTSTFLPLGHSPWRHPGLTSRSPRECGTGSA